MSEFADQKRKIHDAVTTFLETIASSGDRIIGEMEHAEPKYEEQSVVIASQNETIVALQDENARITGEFQVKFDLQEQEITALRSRLAQKDKDFGSLSRALASARMSSQNLVTTLAHALNVVNRDAVGDRVVTQLRKRPTRPGSVGEVLAGAGEPLPTERQARG